MKKIFSTIVVMFMVLIAPVAFFACGPKNNKKKDVYYSITISQMTKGSVQANKTSALSGDTITLTVTADDGYMLEEGSLKFNTTAIVDNEFIMPSENVVIYANFVEEHHTYTINYHVNEWTLHTNPTSFVDETEGFTLTAPTRKGFDFVGWYSDEDCTQPITQIEQGRTGNIDIYPKFNQIFELSTTGTKVIGLTAYGDTLQELVVPNSIDGKDIVEFAISEPCNNVITLTIEDGVKTIPANYTIYGSAKLETVNLPKSINVTESLSGLFKNCEKLSTINLDSENTNLFMQNGVLCQRVSGISDRVPYNHTYLVCYPNGLTAQTFTIPDGVTHLADFGKAKFNKIVIPASVTNLCRLKGSGNPFTECTNLNNIEVNQDSKTFLVDNNILYEIDTYGLRVIHAAKVSGIVKILEGKTIGNTVYGSEMMLENAFDTCDNLQGIICSKSAVSLDVLDHKPNLKIFVTEEVPADPSDWSSWSEGNKILKECENIYWLSSTNQSSSFRCWHYNGDTAEIWQ